MELNANEMENVSGGRVYAPDKAPKVCPVCGSNFVEDAIEGRSASCVTYRCSKRCGYELYHTVASNGSSKWWDMG